MRSDPHPAPFVRMLLFTAAVCCLAVEGSAGESPTDDLRREESAFRARLESLAERCESLGLDEQARITRDWIVPRDPRRQYLFSVADASTSEPAAEAATLLRQWHAKFMEHRRAHAESLWQLVGRFLAADQPADAYRLIHEVLHHDPDHAEARRVLGFRRVGTRWQATVERSKVQVGRTTHPQFGWRRGQYWRVESPHFRVTTDLSPQAGTGLLETLEELHSVWRQVFFRVWSSAEALRELLAGDEPGPPAKVRHEVVLFRDRDEYLAQLKSVEPQIEMTLGYYLKSRRTAFFYGTDPAGAASQLHEVTHQLFHECAGAVRDPGERANFWIVEGAALYMESLLRYAGYHTVGGFDADRLQFARARRLSGEFHLPLAELVRLGRKDLQRHPDLRRIYSEAAGLMQLLMDDDGGRFREAAIDYIDRVNRGVDTTETLAEVIGGPLDELEARYPEFLAVRDDDLSHLQRVAPLRNLSLGHTEVTDGGLGNLAHAKLDQLVWLDLSFTRASDAGVVSAKDAVTLRQLNLEATAISDRTLELVAGFPRLEELDLSGTRITDAGLTHLESLKRLKILWLTGTAVTDASVPVLERLTQLELLDLDDTAVTPEARQRLRERLPGLGKSSANGP